MVRSLSPCRPPVNSGDRVGGSRAPDRLLGLELPRLARRLLSRRAARAAVAGGLRGALRHRRGEHDLLPPAGADGGGAVGGADAGRLRVRREGQPLPDAHPPAARRGRRDGPPGRAHRAARRGRPAAGDALAAAGELPPRRRAPGGRAGRDAARPARVRARHPSWFADDVPTCCASATSRSSSPTTRGRSCPRRRSPRPGTTCASTTGTAGGAATTARASSTPGRGASARCAATSSPTSTTTGRRSRPATRRACSSRLRG